MYTYIYLKEFNLHETEVAYVHFGMALKLKCFSFFSFPQIYTRNICFSTSVLKKLVLTQTPESPMWVDDLSTLVCNAQRLLLMD